ncbi:pentatricopeptide repeat-containing protein At2g21090-like [Selaginella moellendorffii]|uniref:pentatricopeptide repeat-containing protein At2g21090-like n=1 Tax=Selaginella moellendorffii TaxID=88036 RepID=UPI000D1C45C9|nr:pentatricopeptide repeat-containing protein At2g21090-like [Selaginella moellendorffii]|eukprot:XP_024517280.1 pentatricopeptide repeat-containing protein At2g21090-like [Selaginella moellendorffii]
MVVFDPGSLTGNPQLQQALARMEQDRSIDYTDYAKLLKQCGDSKSLEDGRLVHTHIQTNGHVHNRFLTNHIIHMYGRCGSVEDARNVFDSMSAPNAHSWNIMITAYAQNGHLNEARCLFAQMPDLDVVTWNGMITAYSQNGHPRDALGIYFTMNLEGLRPNKVTLITILNACSKLGDWDQGRILHDQIVTTGYLADVMVATALLDMHGKCGRTEYARRVFDSMPGKNEVSWSAMISAYAVNGHMLQAGNLFRALPEWNVVAATAMVQGYALKGNLDTAKGMFDEMPWRNAVSWNALMAGYAQNGQGDAAVDLFRRMDLDGAQPCTVSAVIAVDACTATGAMAQGRAVHWSLRECGMDADVAVANSLVNFFVRCGRIGEAMGIFGGIRRKNVVSWTGVMIAFAQQGDVDEAMRVFFVMQAEGVEADEIAFMIILGACSHSGVLEDGIHCFTSLVQDYKIRPELDHYLCMIDLLGRSGLLFEAEDLINTMPFEPDAVAWRILLNACQMHGKSEDGAAAAMELFGINGKERSSSPYVMISNMWRKKSKKP